MHRLIFTLIFLSVVIADFSSAQSLPDTIIISNFSTYIDNTLSQGVDASGSSGYLILKTSEQENLARRRRATVTYYGTGEPKTATGDRDTVTGNPMRAIDGDTRTFFQIRPGGDGSYILIDLLALRRINKVIIVTFGLNQALRPRAYTIYVGTDSLQLTRVVQRTDNQDVRTLDVFDPVIARFVKITFDVVDRLSSTVISEIEVYGVGYLSSGEYYSRVIDVGQPVNWGWAEWNAELPEGTGITFQFRTGPTASINDSWSPWSKEISKSEIIRVTEPRRYIQFKVNLSTTTTETPVLKRLLIFYNKRLVARNIILEIQPTVVPILRRTEITCNFDVEADTASLGIDTLVVFTPSPANVESVTLNGNPVAYSVVSTPEYVKIAFQQSIRSSARISVRLSLTLYLDINEFPAVAISRATASNPQFVDTRRRGNLNSWTVLTTDVPERLIVDLQVNPNPFSPNGDGINDKVQISFFLANLSVERNLKVQIFDLTGRLVRTIFDGPSKAFAYISSNSFSWDGRDENGKLVRPGVYLLRVAINADSGPESIFRTITVVY
ncbi:MAG: discoidin domain-containing protein [Candidatus Kryptonium sp.]|nr:discoidin domain-containing protein [Candidatus Kryptonium sp.]MCX7762652.1 discoidin domain-containing protein [Candidatus Kryptonium sp.]MDW8108138.1 discoidin domain-containing protein [Candidatus Kryptonium sp.]